VVAWFESVLKGPEVEEEKLPEKKRYADHAEFDEERREESGYC